MSSQDRRALLSCWAMALTVLVILVSPTLATLRSGAIDTSSFQGNGDPNGVRAISPSVTTWIIAIGNPAIVLFAVTGLVVAIRRRWCLAWIACLVATAMLCLATAVPALSSLTIPWYSNWQRISYALAYFAAVFGAIGAVTITREVSRRLQGTDAVRPRLAVAVSTAGLALLCAASVVPEAVAIARTAYARSSLVGPDQRAAFQWLSEHVAPGERVLDQFSDGSGWMATLDRVPEVFGTKPDTRPVDPQSVWGDRWYLLTHAQQLATDQRAQAAARTWNVRYVYVESRVFANHTALLSATDLSSSPAYREVWHRGDASVFEILPDRFSLATG